MKISTKSRYALRLMYDLAANAAERPVSIRDIANRQSISVKYLEQIVIGLHKAGYVKSSRGAQGGYKLTMGPEEYTVGMILRLTEGSLAPVSCLDCGTDTCEMQGNCVAFLLWKKVDDAVNGVIDHITLADLMEWQRQLGSKESDYINCLNSM